MVTMEEQEGAGVSVEETVESDHIIYVMHLTTFSAERCGIWAEQTCTVVLNDKA